VPSANFAPRPEAALARVHQNDTAGVRSAIRLRLKIETKFNRRQIILPASVARLERDECRRDKEGDGNGQGLHHP
jgi:hypothetical protein